MCGVGPRGRRGNDLTPLYYAEFTPQKSVLFRGVTYLRISAERRACVTLTRLARNVRRKPEARAGEGEDGVGSWELNLKTLLRIEFPHRILGRTTIYRPSRVISIHVFQNDHGKRILKLVSQG